MEIIGREIEFGVATEATRGTAETAADKWLRTATANVVERAVHATDETTRGRLEDGEGRRVVQRYVEGDVQGIVHADMLGFLLANIYGAVVSSDVANPVTSHVFNLSQSITHQSLSLFAKEGGVEQNVFHNGMITSLEISATLEDYLRYTASFMASGAAANADNPSYDTEYDFISRDIVVKVATTEAGLSGANAIKAKTVNVTFDQGLIKDHVVGSYNPDDIYNGKMMIEGSMTLNFDDTTFKDYYLNNDELYLSITITGEADLGGGNNPTIELLLNKAMFTEWNRSGDNNDLVTQDISFRAFFNTTDNKQSQVTLQNVTTTYPNVPAL